MLRKDRMHVMHQLSDSLIANIEELATIESIDNGKPIGMAMYDVKGAAGIIRAMAGYAESLKGEQIPMNGNMLCYTQHVPLGVCGQITPWNFPILMAAFKLAPVLASGCTSVLKPAENTPLSTLKIAELLSKTDMPAGVINVLPGFGTEAGAALVAHPEV